MITRANFAQKTQESGVLTNQIFKETYDQLSEYTDGFTRWDDMDDVPELQDVYNDFVATVEKVLAKKQAAPVQPAATPAANDFHTGSSGFIAMYKGRRMDVWADSALEAQTKAAKAFGAKKRYDVDVHFAESREPQNDVPAPDPDRYVNEGKAAIRELLDQGNKKTPAKSKAGKSTQPDKVAPAKKTKAKFKVGQYVRFTRDNRIVRIEEAEYKNLEGVTPGWYYRESTIGWIHESEFGLSSKREFDTRVADSNYHDSNHKVFATPEEVRHMKRFIANERSSTKDGLTKAYKALQRAITSGKIRKGSGYAPMIMLMQQEYHAALNSGAPYRVKPDDFDLAGLVKAVGGPTVYRSVKAMNYLVGKMGQVLDKKAIDGAIKYITGLRMPLVDPFAIQVHEVLATLKKASAKGDTLDISNSNALDLQGLNGLSALMGLAHQCGCGGAGHKSLSGLGDLPVASPKMVVRSGRNAGMKETMTSHELENLSYQTYPFQGKWGELVGNPQTNFTLMVWGSPGAGKSTLMMQFSRYLAENHGNVLYVSSEEFPSYTLKTKLNLVGGPAHGWEFSKTLNSLRADHKFLVIDSTNHYRFTTADLKALMARRPDLSILLVVQITKGGNFKGDQSLEHEVDTVVKVTQEGATTVKNRFQPLSSVPVFDESYSLTPQSNQPHVNQNRPAFY